MPEPVYQSTSFKVGLVKSVFEEQGYGFISGTNRELTSDVFFHFKNLLSPKVKEKNIVVFQTIESTRHSGKQEAVKVVLLSDVIDFSKLLQLYLKYGFTDIFKQICTLTAEEIAKRNPESFLPEVIANELIPASEKGELLQIKRFVKVLKSQLEIPAVLVKKCVKILLESNPALLKDLYFEVYKILEGDPIISSSGIDTLELYRSMNDEQKKSHFKDLSLNQRLQFKNVGAVDSDEEFEDLLSVIKGADENVASNWASISKEVILATKYVPLLWLNDIISVYPAAAVNHHLLEYDLVTRNRLFSKMTVDQLIAACPYKFISDAKSYEFLTTSLYHTKDPIQGLSAFMIAGLELEPVYYLYCVADELIFADDLNEEILKTGLPMANRGYQQRLIAAVGWERSLNLFADELQKDQYKTLRLILESGGFIKTESEKFFSDTNLKPETLFLLWDQGVTELPPAKTLAKYFLENENLLAAEQFLKKTVAVHESIFSAAINLCTDNDVRQTEKAPLRILKAIRDYLPDTYQEAKNAIYKSANEWVRVYLWLYNHSEIFDLHAFAPYFGTLSAAHQKRFIKKTFFEVRQHATTITIKDIISLKDSVIGPEMARDSGLGVDFTVYVTLQALEDLSLNSVTKPEAMYKIIADQVRSPKELLVLEGFFDKCEGRLSIEEFELDSEKIGHRIKSERHEIPKDIVYCEGRKAVIKGTNTPTFCEKTGLEFWWCRNGKCYGSCVTPNLQWENYTLIDFLEIAGVSYSREDYEVFLGYVNKVNKFLKHMNCRSCSEILKPIASGKGGNYGFYRAGSLSCHNDSCDKKGENVYLTHCINGFCSGVIDSRDSVKCRRSNDPAEKTGWYICNDCLACCSSEGIERRRYILNTTGQVYGGPRDGHKDKGIICCPKCGSELSNESASPEDYKRVLDWFIKNRTSSNFIQNSGQRKDGKYWFLVQAPVWDADKLKDFKKKLYKYAAIGFSIPNIRQDKDTYLIAEPFRDSQAGSTRVLTCPNGDYQMEVLSDYDRYFAMSKYHIHVQMPSFRNT